MYRDNGSHTVTGTPEPVPVIVVNSNLSDSGLSSHPVSGVTITATVGENIFVPGNNPSNGDGVLTSTANNRTNNQPITDSNMSGVLAGGAFYLVFNNISRSDNSSGQFFLQWEEIFAE